MLKFLLEYAALMIAVVAAGGCLLVGYFRLLGWLDRLD